MYQLLNFINIISLSAYFNIYTLASTNNNDYIQIIESVVHPQQVMAVKNDKVFVKVSCLTAARTTKSRT